MKHAFSLVELSIVLVILGLLTGGILTGQNLIRAAELRSVTTEYQNYVTAVQTFRDKYFALPGDMRNATDFWGAEPVAQCIGTSLVASTSSATCNGNGNGLISDGVSNEHFRFWQHLANAGLIEGSYSGITGGAANVYVTSLGVNSPRAKFGNTGWFAYNWTSYNNVGTANLFALPNFGNFLEIGAQATNSHLHTNAFAPEEAWNIDTKIDDGKPGRGKMSIINLVSCTTGAVAADLDAEYELTATGSQCALLFVNAF